jgi:hypothetical protein
MPPPGPAVRHGRKREADTRPDASPSVNPCDLPQVSSQSFHARGYWPFATADDQILDFGELLVDRAERGTCFLAKVAQLCLDDREVFRYGRQVCRDTRESQRIFPLVRAKRVDRGQNRAIVGLWSFQRRDPRFQVFQGGHRTILLAVQSPGDAKHRGLDWPTRATGGVGGAAV